MLANSSYVRSRVRRTYGRDAEVVHPPIALDQFPFVADKADYYVSASFLAPYKRIDLVIQAFNEMPDRRLLVVGDGQQAAELRSLAGPNVTFTGHLPRDEFVQTIGKARALIFAGCEDFGITLAEAQACGTPVIAFGRGGACDIVRSLATSPRPTGILFDGQTAAAVKQAVCAFEDQHAITPQACRANAARFSEEAFDKAIEEAVEIACRLHAVQ
jgi:glycosyltransferase involved in cell wall biosynthesis